MGAKKRAGFLKKMPDAARWRRMTAVLMIVCMTVTMLPGYSLAEVTDPDRTMVITKFLPLADEVAQQSVPAGTDESELELPDELEAMGYAKQEEKTGMATASNSEADKDQELVDDTPRPVRITGVRWEPDTVYDPDVRDTYYFTAVLPDRYESEGAELPRIRVTVDGASKQRLLKNGAALPEVATWSNFLPNAREIYANGTPLVIDGPDGSHTTIYIDANGNGDRDEGELSLKEAGIEGAPEDNVDLGYTIVYGGCKNAETASTRITIAGGQVMSVYGGGHADGGDTAVTGDTHVIMTGGVVTVINGGGQANPGDKELVGGNTWVEIRGGDVMDAYGGGAVVEEGISEVAQTAHVTVSEGASVWRNLCGGGTAGSIVKDTDVTITGSQVETVYGGAYKAGAVTGTVTVTVTDGQIGELYADASGSETKPEHVAVHIGGSVVIGDRQTRGIRLDGSGAYGADRFTITEPLDGDDESVTVQLSGAYGDGSVIAANASEGDLKKLKLVGPGMAGKTVYFDSDDRSIKLKTITPAAAPAVDPDEKEVYASGNPLLITGEDNAHTTIYVDANGNGRKDEGEQSLKEAGIEGAPEDGADLRSYKIHGGNRDGDAQAASITMTGGGVYGIYGGGCRETAGVTGDVYVTVSGGEAKYLYGNLENRKVTGKILIAVVGGRVTKALYGQHDFGRMDEARKPADVTVRIGGAAKIGDLSSVEDSYGIVLSPQKGRSGVDHFVIDTRLTGDVVVYLDKDGDESYGDGSVIATCTSSEDVKRIKLTGAGAGRLKAEYDGGAVRLKKLPDPEVDPVNKIIYANGNSLLIRGDSEISTTVYMDVNTAGGTGSGELSLKAAGIPDAPEDGADLSRYTIYGGTKDGGCDSTRVIMTGGSVAAIYGGGHVSGGHVSIKNDTIVTVSGGTAGEVYGGSKVDEGARGGSQIWGTSYVTVSGDAVVTSVYGSGSAGLSLSRHTDVVISGGRISSVYGSINGSNVSRTISVRMTGGVAESVYGHGLDPDHTHNNVSVSVGGSAKVGDGQTRGIMLDASGQYGADRVNIESSLTGGPDAVTVLLSGDYEGGSVIATGVSQSDLAGLKLAGDGAADMKMALEGTELKLIPLTYAAYIGSQGYETLEEAFAAADSLDPQNPTVIELDRDLEWGPGKDITESLVVRDGKSVKLTSRGGTVHTISSNVYERREGMLMVQNGSTLILENVVIDGNEAPVKFDTAAVYMKGGYLILEHGVVIKDHGGPGIGIYTTTGDDKETVSEVIMNGGEISGNGMAGIALTSVIDDLSDLQKLKDKTMRFIMNDGEIRNNRNKRYGGGISGMKFGGEAHVEVIIHGGSITDNICGESGGSGLGGGIYCDGRFFMDGGTVSGNSARQGGGIFFSQFLVEAEITGGTIAGNTASGWPGSEELLKQGAGDNIYVQWTRSLTLNPQEDMDGIYLFLGGGLLVKEPVEPKLTLEDVYDPYTGDDGFFVAQESDSYTMTEADAAKFSCESGEWVFELENNQLKLYKASYDVSYSLTGIKGAEILPERAERKKEFRVKLVAEDGFVLPASGVSVQVGSEELREGLDYQLENTAESCVISVAAGKLTGDVEITAKADRRDPGDNDPGDNDPGDNDSGDSDPVSNDPASNSPGTAGSPGADIQIQTQASSVTTTDTGTTVSVRVDPQTVDASVRDARSREAVGEGLSEKAQLPVEIWLPAEALTSQLNNPDGRKLTVEVEIPTSVSGGAATSVTALRLPKEVLQAAKNAGKDITITIKDERGYVSSQWMFSGKDLKDSAQAITDVNLAMAVVPVKTLTGGGEPIKALVADAAGLPGTEVPGLSIRFGHSGPLPAAARVRIPVGNNAGIRPGGAVDLYYCNTASGRLELQPGSPYTVDQDGYVILSLSHCYDYVLVPVKATEPDR